MLMWRYSRMDFEDFREKKFREFRVFKQIQENLNFKPQNRHEEKIQKMFFRPPRTKSHLLSSVCAISKPFPSKANTLRCDIKKFKIVGIHCVAQLRENSWFKRSTLDECDHLDDLVHNISINISGVKNFEKKDSLWFSYSGRL